MKTGFDWQIEDDQEKHARRRTDEAPRSPRFSRPLMLLAFSLLFLSVFVSYWALSRHQQSQEDKARAEVTAAFALLRGAVTAKDSELFSSLLSGASWEWRRTQKFLWQNELLWDRAALGFLALPEAALDPDTAISPDLAAAELTFAQRYTVPSVPAPDNTVNLRQTTLFQKHNGSWVSSPYTEEFWGAQQKYNTSLLSVTFPQRDADLVLRLADDLQAALESLCAALEPASIDSALTAVCAAQRPLQLQFSTDVATLADLDVLQSPLGLASIRGADLPAPTLVGLPVDERGYQALSDAYRELVLAGLNTRSTSSGEWPAQPVRALCFRFPQSGQTLFRYDPGSIIWEQELGGHPWRQLASLSDDTIVLLQGDEGYFSRGDTRDANFTIANPDMLADGRAIGWTGTKDAQRLIFQDSVAGVALPRYAWLDISACRGTVCTLVPLDGFPVLAPGGRHTLLQAGAELALGDDRGAKLRTLARGFSPFWLDEQQFGFVRFGQLPSGEATTEIVLTQVNGTDSTVLLNGANLATAASIPQSADLFVDYVLPSPGDARQLLISATGIRDLAGQYFIFTYQLPGDGEDSDLLLQVQRSGAPGGLSGVMTPTGLPPFLASSDGRWLAMTELQGHNKETWTILLHDLWSGTTRQLADSVPATPGNFPLLDWSEEGQWLLVADRQDVRFFAPFSDYEVAIAHDFDACTAVVWSH